MKEIHLKFQSVKSIVRETLTLYNGFCLRFVDLNVEVYLSHSLLVIVGDTKLVALLAT